MNSITWQLPVIAHRCRLIRAVRYPGTPEPDRFPNGPDDQRSQVLLVDLDRGRPAEVKPHPTGRFQWHRITMTLNGDGDLARLE